MATTETNETKAKNLPPIFVAEEQFDELSEIAERLADVLPEVSEFLDQELSRAKLMPLSHLPREVVTVNSTVEFVFGMKGRPEKLKLVYPAKDIPEGCISLASPVGVALLGMREGETISWTSPHGDQRWLRVVKVVNRD